MYTIELKFIIDRTSENKKHYFDLFIFSLMNLAVEWVSE